MKPESTCAWRFNISVARRQHSAYRDEARPDDSGVPVDISPSPPPAQRANKRPPQGGRLRKVTTECFSHPRYLLPPGDRLLGFCLFSTLEMIVGLHEDKPRTLPLADRKRLYLRPPHSVFTAEIAN